MNDLISRQAAIDALCKAGCESRYCGASCDDVKAIEQLPPAQPETHDKRTETHARDLIDRQAAIDALGDMVMNWTDSDYELGQLNQWKADRKAIIDLPSAQPEIIHCCECKYWKPGFITDDDDFVPPSCAVGWVSGVWRATDYCSNAERRQDD